MLRRRLLAILGSLVLLVLVVAITAIFLLQGFLADLSAVRSEAMTTVDLVSKLSGQVARVQIELYRLQQGSEYHLDELICSAEELQHQIEELSQNQFVKGDSLDVHLQELRDALPAFYTNVGALATSQDPTLAIAYNREALSNAVQMNQAILEVSQAVREKADSEQSQLIARFRWIVLALGIAFVLLINCSILILLRAAEMVLQPVDRLVEASRALAEEKFETRINIAEDDEFGELARSFNATAERLQANEQRKLETLHQVALTLNHELNNAMIIIQMQLELLKRSTQGNEGQERYLRQIRDNLERMAKTVEALKRVRRIVLTDYVAGQQMLDLEKSTEPGPATSPPEGKSS